MFADKSTALFVISSIVPSRTLGWPTIFPGKGKYLILVENEIYFQFSFDVNRNNYTKICLLKNLIECNPDKKKELINISEQINENNIVPFYDQINHNKIKELLPLNFN